MKKRIEQQSSTSQSLLCRTEYETEFHTAFWCDKRAPDILGHPEPITGCCHFPAGAWDPGNGSPCAGLIVHGGFDRIPLAPAMAAWGAGCSVCEDRCRQNEDHSQQKEPGDCFSECHVIPSLIVQ